MEHDWWMALAGGAAIGLAAAALLLFNGRIFGVSGIVGSLVAPQKGEIGWRLAVVLGLLCGGATLVAVYPSAFSAAPVRPLALTAVAGLLVGFGARLGGGCTSGHGVCGIGRLSLRSVVATVTFIAAGIATVAAVSAVVAG